MPFQALTAAAWTENEKSHIYRSDFLQFLAQLFDHLVCLIPPCWLWTGQKLLDSLAETWDFFFCDVLSMLQAIFYPVQVHVFFFVLSLFNSVLKLVLYHAYYHQVINSIYTLYIHPSIAQLLMLDKFTGLGIFNGRKFQYSMMAAWCSPIAELWLESIALWDIPNVCCIDDALIGSPISHRGRSLQCGSWLCSTSATSSPSTSS